MSLNKSLFSAVVFVTTVVSSGATEYFVGKQGNDGNDGLSKEQAFLTIQKGVDALKAGDTLTLAPGEYGERVKRDNLGGPDRDTVIRAEIPGTVLLRGDVPAPEFKKVEGYRFVYAAAFDRDVQVVNEVDTLTIMETAPNVTELEFSPGVCFYDAGQKQLYLSTSDMQPPGTHHYTVSVIKNFGLFLHQPERVIVEGLTFTGFHSREILAGSPGDFAVWGIMLAGGKRCVIRQCTAFLNAGGISEHSGHFRTYTVDTNQIPTYRGKDTNITDHAQGPGGNVIEQCRAYGNYSRHSGSGGNIIIFDSDNDRIRDCETHSSATHGIRHYGGIHGPALMSNNLSWGNVINDIHIKGGRAPEFGFAEQCVTLGALHVVKVNHCMLGKENRYNSSPGADNVRYDLEACATRDREFADPDNLDFRLQSDSQFRGTGPSGVDRGPFPYQTNIFYVKPGGDDQADGLSMGRAWKTPGRALKNLRPGDTLYLDGGTYDMDLDLAAGTAGGKTIFIRGHGTVPVLLKGRVRIAQSHAVAFVRLTFAGGITINECRGIRFDNCRFSAPGLALQAKAVEGLHLTHDLFTGFDRAAVDLASCSNVRVSGTIFDNRQGPALRLDRIEALRYSDYNSYRNSNPAWEVGGKGISLATVQPQHECYSRVLTPEIGMDNGGPFLKNKEKFSAGGPHGTALGVYREFKEKLVRVSAPVAYSVTPTTANVEWWTSIPARCDVAWGDTPDCANKTLFNTDGFGSFSLTGLKPGTKYYFKITAALALSNPGDYFLIRTTMLLPASGRQANPDANPDTAPLVFETARALAQPVVYYVAPDGNDRNSGVSRVQAFRTVTRAAQQANAGDTVLMAGGVYKETVRIRATGLPDRPIVFKSLPGEKVIFDGDNKTMARAFMVSGKHYVHFDGLYFRYFSPGTRTSGIMCLYQCDGIQITRCFKDGRHGYSPSFVNACGCADLTIRNCAIVSAVYGNIYMVKCPNALIENNVVLRSLIMECNFINEPDQKIRLKNNIITDNVPHKVLVPLLEVACRASLVEENNCYFFRIPPEKRKLFMFYDPVAYERTVTGYGLKLVEPTHLFTNFAKLTLAEFQQKSGYTNSFAANPGFKATVDMKTTDKDGKPVFLVDLLLGKKDLDFPDLFATDPDVVRRGIGLQPDEFKDFPFKTGQGSP